MLGHGTCVQTFIAAYLMPSSTGDCCHFASISSDVLLPSCCAEQLICAQIEKKIGTQTYPGLERGAFKPRNVSAFLEYPKHYPRFPRTMIEFPVLRVHPILIPELEDVGKDEQPKPEDLSNPFNYALPWLDMKSELSVGDADAFP